MSKSSASHTSGGGIGCGGVLTLLFAGLKLSGLIDWPWVWVLSPLWISAIITVLAILLAIMITIAIGLVGLAKR